MSDVSSWPPPPTTFAAPMSHDAFLTACVLNSLDKKPVSRRSLASELYKKDGDWRQSFAVVDDYCDRQEILMSPRGFVAWGAVLLPILNAPVTLAVMVAFWFLERRRIAAVTHLVKRGILGEELYLALGILGFIILEGCIVIFLALRTNKKLRCNAELARQKLMAQANTKI